MSGLDLGQNQRRNPVNISEWRAQLGWPMLLLLLQNSSFPLTSGVSEQWLLRTEEDYLPGPYTLHTSHLHRIFKVLMGLAVQPSRRRALSPVPTTGERKRLKSEVLVQNGSVPV